MPKEPKVVPLPNGALRWCAAHGGVLNRKDAASGCDLWPLFVSADAVEPEWAVKAPTPGRRAE